MSAALRRCGQIMAAVTVVLLCMCVLGSSPVRGHGGRRAGSGKSRNRIPDVDGRFEYQYSFKGPHLQSKSGSVGNFEVGGNAIPTDNLVRLTTSVRNRQGWIWSTRPALMTSWTAFLEIRIMGRGRLGGNGM